jgi:hypothetical protein
VAVPSNGKGLFPPGAVTTPAPAAAADEEVDVEEARGARANPPLRPPDAGMFSHYTKKKRFSFFS